jgi:hypothetical protein
LRDHGVDAVRPISDVFIDPLAFFLELLGRETHSAEDSDATGLAHSDHDVAAMGKRKYWNIDPKALANFCPHLEGSPTVRVSQS